MCEESLCFIIHIMNEPKQKISYYQKNQIKIKKITELMQKLFSEKDGLFYKITLKAKTHESTGSTE